MRAALSRLSAAHWPQAFDNLQQASADVSIILLARMADARLDFGPQGNSATVHCPTFLLTQQPGQLGDAGGDASGIVRAGSR